MDKLKNTVVTVVMGLGMAFDFFPLRLRFAVKNRRFWRRYFSGAKREKNTLVLAEASTNIYMAIGTSILANVLAKVYKANVFYLAYNRYDNKELRWLRGSFSSCLYGNVHDITEHRSKEIEAATKELYETLRKPEDVLELKYNGLLVGDLVYDKAMMATGHWQATIWSIDDRIYSTLRRAIEIIDALEIIAEKHDVKAVTFSHPVGLGGLPSRYFANRSVESYSGVVGIGPIRKYHSFNGKRFPYTGKLSSKMLDYIIQDKEHGNRIMRRANEYLTHRTSGKVAQDIGSSSAFDKTKKIYTNRIEFNEQYGLSTEKPCVFIMLHVFNDYPHHFERNIFTDYYRWVIETLKIVKEIPAVNWIFKEHPAGENYPNDANLNGIFELNDHDNILFMDQQAPFNSVSLRYVAHAIITCIGTAGLEFSVFGVPCILAGENHFSGHDICYEPQTYEEYKDILENIINAVSPLDERTREKAQLLLYIQYDVVFGMGSASNNNAFLPMASQSVMLENDLDQVASYALNELDSPATLKYLEEFSEYVLDKDRQIFIKDRYLASVEKRVNIEAGV